MFSFHKLLPRDLRRIYCYWKGLPPEGIHFAGQWMPWSELQKGLIFTGGIGSGKTKSSESLIRALMRAGCPILAVSVKPNEYRRLATLCEEEGVGHRMRRIAPDNPASSIDFAGQLMRGGGAADLAATVTTLGDVEKASEGGQHSAFFRNTEDGSVRYAARLSFLATGRATLDDIYEIISSAPNSLESAEKLEYEPTVNAHTAGFGQDVRRVEGKQTLYGFMIHKLYLRTLGDRSLVGEFNRIHKFFTREFCATENIHGGALAGVNGTLGRFRDPPLRDALNNNSLTPEMIAEQGLIGLLDYSVMEHGMSARLYNLIWVLLCQRYLMGRDASGVKLPFVILRDECPWVLHGEADIKANNVLRSQGVCDIALFQDIDTLEVALGGGPKARHEAMAFIANHVHKTCFSNDSEETNRWASTLSGQVREVTVSSGNHQPQDFAGRALGAQGINWSFQYQPLIRPEYFSRLPVACAYVFSGGRVRLVNFRRKR